MSPSAEAVAHQKQRAAQAAATAKLTAKLWKDVDPHNLSADWQTKVHRVAALVAAGQLAAAQKADPYLAGLLTGVESVGRVAAVALTGVASDGRSLPDLLMYPVWSALSAIQRGMSLAQSLATGGALLDLLSRTMVADAGRAADLIAMAARPAITSYVRVVELPACSRCIVLAGAEYGISSGFQRHPRCDCTMEPVTKNHSPAPTSPKTMFASMPAAERIKRFGPEAVKAIEAGADVAQVVNARRGMGTATVYGRKVQKTTEGITRRSQAGSQLGRDAGFAKVSGKRYAQARTPRLMPEEIMRIAGDRDEAVRLLKRYGYIY